MDERHWWIAGKIQETFHVGGYDNPTLLEDVMTAESTLQRVNRFLKAGGPCRLFFYAEKPESGFINPDNLQISGTLASLKDVNLDSIIVLYFLRNRVDKDVDPSRMEKDIFCGELKHNAIETLTALLSEIYIPLIKAQKDWGQCNDEGQIQLTSSMDKFMTTLNESSASVHHSKQMMLKLPEHIVVNDFKQQRVAALDTHVILEYEKLVQGWMTTIEAILHDTTDDRFIDPNAGPLSELDKWRRRQRLLTSITEQLKSKECKAVIVVLITAKSKLLKRWKAVDAGITDAMNETKDKVKYLESLRRHLDQLYNGATPSTILNSAIPGLFNAMKQMDSVSRFYAKTGYLGLLLTKVTNQIVLSSKEFLRNVTLSTDDSDVLWECVTDEIKQRDTPQLPESQSRSAKAHVDARVKTGLRGKVKEPRDLQEENLFGRLKACLSLQIFYRDALRSLRETLGAVTSTLSHMPSISSVAGSFTSRSKHENRGSRHTPLFNSPKKASSIFSEQAAGHGVSMTDEEAILGHMDLLCNRIRQFIDVINTLAQYTKMIKTTNGMPRPHKDDLEEKDDRANSVNGYYRMGYGGESPPNPDSPEKSCIDGYRYDGLPGSNYHEPLGISAPMIGLNLPDQRNLVAISEDEEQSSSLTMLVQVSSESTDGKKTPNVDAVMADEFHDVVVNISHGLTREEIQLLRKYFTNCPDDDGPSACAVVKDRLASIHEQMSQVINTKSFLDVESRDRERFDEQFTNFQAHIQDLEAFLAAYLHALFMRKMKTQEGLDIINRFTPVQNRTGIRGIVADKFVELFHWYQSDLEDVQNLYEKNKDGPLMMRNAPPVAGAIHWSRQLLKRIEDPMKIFRDNKAVSHLGDFSRVVKQYNRLATVLVTFESLWFSQWKGQIDQAKNGLKATLFVHHPVTSETVVNVDERVLELIQEAKWLTRLGIQIPESAVSIMLQEERFKTYNSNLDLVLSEYREVFNSIPPPLKNLFGPHLEHVQQQLMPGFSTLTWNSMNIDAFLHQIHTATRKLKRLEEKVHNIVRKEVDETIDKIEEFVLFDYQHAFSKSWAVGEFKHDLLESIHERSLQLSAYVKTVEDGLVLVASNLSTKKVVTIAAIQGILKNKHKPLDNSYKVTSTGNPEAMARGGKHGRDKSMLYMDDDEADKEKQRQAREDIMLAQLLEHYQERVYRAVLNSVCRSLVTLAEASGCHSDAVRAFSSQSLGSSSERAVSSVYSRGTHPLSRRASRFDDDETLSVGATSALSRLSSMTWSTEKSSMNTYLQFAVQVKFSIPTIIVEPTLDVIQNALMTVTNTILDSSKGLSWVGMEEETFHRRISEDGSAQELVEQIACIIENLEGIVQQHLFHFSWYNFLWKDDMHGNYIEFINSEPGTFVIKREVERMLAIEKKVLAIPQMLPVGPVSLYTDPIKDALHGFAMAWKTKYASVLHEEAKRKLDAAVLYRSEVNSGLELSVQTLDQLNSALHLLEELHDMENKIDAIYLPIETMYAKLREFELRLPRGEVEEVDELRDKWQELLNLADTVREVLLKERRGAFEQELDKQVKTFVVEVIQFRNAFDAQGPAVPGIPPAEAVARLYDFQKRFAQYDSKRKTLDSVSKLFGIVCKPFPELDKTGEELELLSQLYGLFQKFIRFDNKFRDTLWAEVDLDTSFKEVESCWDECLALPSKLKDWDAYHDLKNSLHEYLEVFPLLQSLASKEIRNRHWLQVMHVTGSSFQLEANVFKLCHLLDIGLIKHKQEIEQICRGASRELELEIKMRMTEEEWTEQVLTFEHYKKRGPMYLDKANTERLLEQLEDAQALLANMLTSRYIGPLRDEAASWAEKLKEVGEVLEMWLEVQDLWQYLEAVFSNSLTAKELPQEAKRFAQIDKGWTKMMKRAFDTRNVLQCCYGGEVPKAVVLRHIYEELEICFKSLVGYLDNKRRGFPRFYFVSDPILLSILSRPNDLESVKPHLRTIFSAIHDVKLEKAADLDSDMELDGSGTSISSHRSPSDQRISMSSPSGRFNAVTPKTDKRLTQHHDHYDKTITHAATTQHVYLPSEFLTDQVQMIDAVAVSSIEGESIILDEKVQLMDGVEMWLDQLHDAVSRTLKAAIVTAIQELNSGVTIDELAIKYPSQVCHLTLLYYWTRECEQGIAEVKYERKSLPNAMKRFNTTISRLPPLLARGSWRSIDEPMLPVHKVRLESLIYQSTYLRDIMDSLCQRKLREVTDFDWRRSIKLYLQNIDEKLEPMVCILDASYNYGNEYYGAQSGISLTPQAERCFLSMSQAMQQYKGSSIIGPTGCGKTETTRGLAHCFGRFLGIFCCCPQTDAAGLGKILQGLAMDGCWGCFDEAQTLNKEAMSVLLDYTQAIITAMRAKQNYTTLADGQEIHVARSVGIFLTSNVTTQLPTAKMPMDLQSLFRTVSLIKPDTSLILKAKCTVYGFKAAGTLGSRLKILIELVKDQLPPFSHHNFTVAAMEGVLLRACQKRRAIRDERSFDKREDQPSRCNSQASEAPMGKLGFPSQMSFIGTSTLKMASGGRKTATPNSLTQAARIEHSLVGHSLEEIIGPRLDAESMVTFKSIVKDVFGGLPDPPAATQALSGVSRTVDLESALELKATEAGLVPHKPWLLKCEQLYAISQVHHGVIVAGPSGSGKSSCIQILVDALSIASFGSSRHSNRTEASTFISETNHKLQRINPLVVDDSALMFGYLNQNHDFVDGIFTSTFKKANRNQSTTWLCLDGPLNDGWSDIFSSVIDAGKVLHLKNGDKLQMSDNVKLLFETDNLNSASPGTVSRTGIVFLDKDVLGWKPIAKAWLETRNHQENHVLQRAFHKTVDPVSQFVLSESRLKLQMCEVGMFQTCLNLLSAMLADNIELGGELHIERLFLFCLIWTFGGLLDKSDYKPFSDLLNSLSTALPDDDRDIIVFDYYVDESGEWDPWHSRVPEAVYQDNINILGDVMVDTVNTIRTRLLMEFASASGQNVLLVGPPGSGKTFLINDFIDIQDSQTRVSKKLVFSGASSARQLQQFIESNIYHRQGFVYGAKDNKKLQVFVDDVNLPNPDAYGVQRCNELLRQLLDDKVLCTLQKPFEWKAVEGLSILAAMSLSEFPSVANRYLSERLLRHFAVFWLPMPKGEALKSVVYGILEANMMHNERPALEIDIHTAMVDASCKLLVACQDVLRPTPMPGRHHYFFSLRDIAKCFQCLKRLPDESRADDSMVTSLWKHEILRTMRDRIVRTPDTFWFDKTLKDIMTEMWADASTPVEHFVTFPIDTRVYQRHVTATGGNKHMKISLQPVENLSDLHTCLNTHLTHYNEEFGNVQLNIMVSDFIISHVVRMHRVLSFHNGGNMLLIGAVGAHLATLCRLALHVANIPIHPIDSTKQNTFFDGLRSAIRLSGSEGKIIALLFTARDLRDPTYLDAINSLLVSGEYPHLFSNDEIDGLLQAIAPQLKRDQSGQLTDPMKFFVSRVKCNLHMIICLPPTHNLLTTATSECPGLLSGCQISWMCEWPHEALLGEATYYIAKFKLMDEFEETYSHAMTTCLANIHSFALRDCRQLTWAGDLSEEITVNQVKIAEKKKDQIKIVPVKVPNLPYSKTLMQESIRMRHRDIDSLSKNDVYVGPTTYRRFMNCFHYLYTRKARERTETVDRLKKVLATLDQTRADVKVMKKAIKSITAKSEEAKETTTQLMRRLTMKATALEKLKAKIGLSSSLDAYLQLTELESDEEEDDQLLRNDEYDEYDKQFDAMYEANLKTRQVQAKEELESSKQNVEDARKQLSYAREQVLHWRSKVDRQCAERVKAFVNPPLLVGQVMEMIMVLIGKRLPSSTGLGQQREHRDHLKDEMSSRMSSSSSSTRMALRKVKPNKEASDRVDRTQWKAMQVAMSDSLKFVDMMHNVSWEDGLNEDVLNAVESYLAKGRDGQLGVTGEGTLLDNAADKQFSMQRRSPSPDNSRGITIAAARYSSEDCATLVQYAIAIVEYTHKCTPLRQAMERLHELEREIEENERIQREKLNQPDDDLSFVLEPEPDYTEEDLPLVQEEVNKLQVEFDASVVQKHSLQLELQSMNERLKAATEMVESMKAQEAKWRQHVADNDGNELLLGNCITAAAFLTYCGPVNTDTRLRMGEFFMHVCEHHGLPMHKNQLFRNIELFDFLYTPLDLMQLTILKLPSTRLMLENACFLTQDDSTTAWPLLCDPTARLVDWLTFYMTHKGLIKVKYHELRSQLENCLSEGQPLLITDCNVHTLMKDGRLRDTIQKCKNFIHGKSPFKVMVGDHEVECSPDFRLFLQTSIEPHLVPHQLAAFVATVYFQQSRQCMEEELLDRFMAQEKSRLEDERTALIHEKTENMRFLERIENQMLTNFSSDIRLLNDLAATKKLAELKKQFDETEESQGRVETSQLSIMRARESYRVIARRGAVCFDASQYMREINELYQVSFGQFLEVYDAAISHSERAAVKAVVERLTYSAFVTMARSLLEKDRVLYCLLLAIEIEDSLGNVGVGEREFLISPNFGSMVMSASGISQPHDGRITQIKKPFDWMLDDQFHNLHILGMHYEWFVDMFERMPKDGRETQWRNLCENDYPEKQSLPDKMDDVYNDLQRMLVIRAVRSDRLMQMAALFVSKVLGKRYVGELGIDLPLMLRQSSLTTPLILLYSSEVDSAEKLFSDFAQRKQTRTLMINLSEDNPAVERSVKKLLQRGMSEGLWVLLHNAHNAPHLLNSLDSILLELSSGGTFDSQFRCWLTAQVGVKELPVRLLQNSIKAMINSPKIMKDSLIRSFNSVDPDLLRQTNRSEWPAVLHNICYLHSTLRLRARFGHGGWNAPGDFLKIGSSELQEVISFVTAEFKDNILCMTSDGSQIARNTSWTGIRYMLTEVIYGNYTTDPYDQQTLSAIVDYWVSPNSIKKDFEVARLKYKIPASFFHQHARLSNLLQGLDGIGNYFLEVPEACHIHPNLETLLGDDQYIFTRLNKVHDVIPSSKSLSHKLFPRPPTPFNGPPLAGISAQSNHPSICDKGVFATACHAMLKMRKEVDLWELCYTMLPKVPKAYNKEYIVDRVKKIGGFTAFNTFIVREMDQMYKLLTEIRNTLQAIKSAAETDLFGDHLSPQVLAAADDLFHMRIPEAWCRQSGTSAPPLTWNLGQWLVDLQNRCHHFEKILIQGREKMPAYWLGAFFNPRGLLAMIKQDAIRQFCTDRSGQCEQFVFQTEVTSRDKDHLRDPPQEGIFVYGIHFWGCAWEKTTGELMDSPPKQGCTALPVVHVTCWPASEKPLLQDAGRASETYQCPVYASRVCQREPIMEMDVRRENVPASRWALRGLSATIRPY